MQVGRPPMMWPKEPGLGGGIASQAVMRADVEPCLGPASAVWAAGVTLAKRRAGCHLRSGGVQRAPGGGSFKSTR